MVTRLHSALAAATTDRLFYDLAGIEDGYDALGRELPGVRIRFALKSCPVDEVLAGLARRGSGIDAASPGEIRQALRAGVPVERIHYGNTVKSNAAIAEAYTLGIRDFATDSRADVRALAAHAPGARVFARLATAGTGAVWGLSEKCGTTVAEAVEVLTEARAAGLVPAGLSVHVGSQQMTARAWRRAVDDLAAALIALRARGIALDHVNLGGGLPALGYPDLRPPLGGILAEIRAGLPRLRAAAGRDLGFRLEPGRHLVADHGAVRAHVTRLTVRPGRGAWLYLSCGKFNGLYEMDQLRYRLEFPGHPGSDLVPAVVAGPSCDSDDAFDRGRPVPVPRGLRSGDPVWVLSAGAYAVSYTTRGFNGFEPLPVTVLSLLGSGVR